MITRNNVYTFFFSLFFLFSVTINAQQVDARNTEQLTTDTIAKEVLDNAKYRIFYSMKFVEDSKFSDIKTETQTVLLVGLKHSAFLDYNTLRKDSVYDALSKSGASPMEIIGTVMPIGREIKFKPTIIKDYPQKGSHTFQQMISSKESYRYTDNDVKMDWKLEDEERKIKGYMTKKAICTFRGRDYIAWYCPEIAINEGPYIFSGLPGLILEIYDTKNHYEFSMNGLKLVEKYDPLYLESKNVVKSSRSNVRKAVRNLKVNPASMLKLLSVSAKVTDETLDKIQPKPYNPIELE